MSEVDHVLRSQVDRVNRLVVQLQEQVGAVSGQVNAVGAATQQARGELQQLRDEFLAFARQTKLTANVQLAQTRVGVVQDKIQHEFGHHKKVRRTAVGMLQAFDTGLVSEEVVRNVSDELMIQSPRYWLAPALVALAAWSADDRALCDRAVEEAFRRSPARTSLLFALVLRRQGRQETSVRWLRHYLRAQNPAELGREFAVILESISQGAFGGAGRELLRTTLAQWREALLDDESADDAQVARWRAEVESLRGPSAQQEFPRLAAVSPQWAQLDAALGAARAQRALLDKYSAMLAREDRPSQRLEDAVDDILDRLVSEYDTEELPHRRELAYQEAVISHGGDEDAARKAADLDHAALEETLDYLTVQTTSALTPAAIGASPATQRLSVAACADWFARAHAGFSRDYQASVPADVQAHFATQHSLGAQTFNLPPWTGSFTTPPDQLEHSLVAHWDHHTAVLIASLAYPLKRKLIGPAAVSGAVLLLFMGLSAWFAIIAALIVFGIWGGVLYQNADRARKHQHNVRVTLEAAKHDSVLHLRGAYAELRDWQSRYQEADALMPKARELIKELATAQHAASPYDGRVVSGTAEGNA